MEPPAELSHLLGRSLGAMFVTDTGAVEAASVDWTGRYHGAALGLVEPRSAADVAQIIGLCRELGVGLVAQGGNTGLVAGATPLDGELVLSTRHLTRLDPVDRLDGTLVVGAGVTVGTVQRHAASAGWRYGIDFGARDSATIGGSIATNAGGNRVRHDGNTRAQLLGVEAVTGTGAVIGDLRGLHKDNTGYHLPSLLCGSEGTLAVITAACVALRPPLGSLVTALVGFDSVDAVLAALTDLRRSTDLVSGELMLGPGVGLVAETFGLGGPFAQDAAAYLLVEVAADNADDLAESLAGSVGIVAEAVATDRPRRDQLWSYRELHTEAIGRLGAPHKLDVTVSLGAMSELLDSVPDTLAAVRPEARVWMFGHAVDGNIHVNITGVDPDDDEVDDLVLQLVAGLGGSISAEHGIGRAKRRWLGLNRTDAELATFAAIKAAFDPDSILNPGCLLG